MDNSTEELTPILVPFEKSTLRKRIKAEQARIAQDPSRTAQPSDSAVETTVRKKVQAKKDAQAEANLNQLKANIHNSDLSGKLDENGVPIPSIPKSKDLVPSRSGNNEDSNTPSPDETPAPGPNPANNGASPTATPTPTNNPSKKRDWSGNANTILGGTALAANAAGSLVGGLGTVGNATRKLVQGMLNPGLMGQGAAGASLDAVDTVVTPDDAAKARMNNLQEAAGVFAEGKELDDQKKAAAASAKTFDQMDQVINGMFQQALQNNQFPDESYLHFAGGVDPNNPQGAPLKMNAQQYEGFLHDFEGNLSGIMNQWIADGRDPEMIKELNKKYGAFIDSAKDRYKEMRDMDKAHQDTVEAGDAADRSANAAAAVNIVKANIKYNMNNFINNPNVRWGTDFMQWALSKGFAARDENTGELILNKGDLFIDDTGKTMDQGILNPNTTTFNFTDENMGMIDDYLDYLDHIRANDPVQGPVAAEAAATLRAQKIAFDERKKKFAADGPIKFYKDQLTSTLGSTVPIKTGNLHGAQAQLVQGMQNSFNKKLIDTIGPLTGISAEQYASFANNGGIATTSLKDYDTLKQVHTQFHDYLRTNRHREKLMNIQNKIQYAIKNDLPIPALSPQELEVYTNELMYQNMNTKLFAMEKMKKLDEELDSFHRQIDEYGQGAKNADGTTAYMKQVDLFDRTRDAAYEKLQDALNESNTILEESFVSLAADPTKRTAGQYVYNTTTKPPQLVFVPYSNAKDPRGAQTRHLFDMVTSPHAMSPTYGATSNGRADVVYGTNNAKYGRDIQNRMTDFMTAVDEASEILGGRKNLPEGQVATASSDVSQNASAIIDAMATSLANRFGIVGDDAISNLSSIKVPPNSTGVGPLDKNLVSKYGYGVFSPSKPLTANAVQDIKGLVQNIDDIINLSASAPNGTMPMSTNEIRALKQYRAALVTNVANAYIKNMINSASTPSSIDPKVEQAVLKYLFPGKIPNYMPGNVIKLLKTVTGEIDGGISAEFENVTPTKNFSKNLLDPDRNNYLGSQAAPKGTTANAMISAVMSDPNNIVGLMNAVYSTM